MIFIGSLTYLNHANETAKSVEKNKTTPVVSTADQEVDSAPLEMQTKQ
jgi:hypothetical protein